MNYQNAFVVKKRSIIYILIILVFSFITAMRGNTLDTINYKILYDTIDFIPLDYRTFYDRTYMEFGYGLLNAFFKFLNFDFRVFLFFYAFITFIFIKQAADNFGANSVLVLFCYLSTFYFIHQWIQIRQGLSIAIAYYAVSVLVNRNQNIKFSIFYIIAISIHNVAAPFIIFFKNILFRLANYLGRYYYWVALILFVSTIVACRLFFSVGLGLSERLVRYAESEESRSLLHPVNLRAYLFLILFLCFRPRENVNKILDFLILINVMGVGIRLGFYDFLILSGRLGTIFTYSEIFIIPLLLSLRFKASSKIIFAFLYFVISLYISIVLQTPDIIEQYFKPLL